MTDGDIHGLSYQLGRNTEGLESLTKMFEQHCEDDDRRHVENVTLLTENTDAIKSLREALAPLVANQALTKRRMAVLASVGLSLLVAFTWALDAAVKWAVGWVLKAKFGG